MHAKALSYNSIMISDLPLFRRNAVEAQAALNGRVRIAPPPSWTATNMLLLGVVIATIIFISLADYSRTIEVTGNINSENGTPEIKAPATGYVILKTKEGQAISKGDELLSIEPRIANENGDLALAREKQSKAKIDAVETRTLAARRSANAAKDAAFARMTAARSMLSSLKDQLQQSEKQTQIAKDNYDRARTIAERGFVSQRELDERENTVASSKERESRIRAEIAMTLGDIESARAESIRISSEADVTIANADIEIAEEKQIETATANTKKFVVYSPVTGEIASLPVKNGQIIEEGSLVAIIASKNEKNIAHLQIPASHMAGLQKGQNVRVSVDAYPYQTYGTIKAKIISISKAARQSENGPVFDIVINMPKTIKSYGKQAQLLPGMTVSARIQTQKRTIIEWLLDPLISVNRR